MRFKFLHYGNAFLQHHDIKTLVYNAEIWKYLRIVSIYLRFVEFYDCSVRRFMISVLNQVFIFIIMSQNIKLFIGTLNPCPSKHFDFLAFWLDPIDVESCYVPDVWMRDRIRRWKGERSRCETVSWDRRYADPNFDDKCDVKSHWKQYWPS